jgi:predicted nucleotidyltransferase
MVSTDRFPLSDHQLSAFCVRHRIRKLSLFGSILSDRFGPQSDVDMLVEFEPGVSVGLIRRAGIQIELTELIGRQVDLRTPAELSRYFRQRVLDSAEVRYVHR